MPNSLPDKGLTPFSDQQYQQLQQLLAGWNQQQIAWVGGFFSGLAVQSGGVAVAAAPVGSPEITILVGSQTGNSEKLAKLTHERATARGLRSVVKKMGDYKTNQLKSEKNVLVIVSTHGEGEPPDNTREMHEFIFSKRAPQLKETHFSVLALGDSSYEHFCQTGVDFDKRFEELGAVRLHPRVDCDVDYDDKADAWIEAVLTELAGRVGSASTTTVTVSTTTAAPATPVYSRRNPFPSTKLADIVLNGRGSSKEVHHIELSLAESGLTYEPGDSLGVYPTNDPKVWGELLSALHLSGENLVTLDGKKATMHEAFAHQLEVTLITRPVIQKYAALAKSKKLDALLAEENKKDLAEYLYGRELIDLVTEFPVPGLMPQQFVDCLRKLPPRLYSIASSLRQHPDEVHLTVAAVRYESHGRARKGVCSTYLADRIGEDVKIPVYIDGNSNFKLPSDPSRSIIMIGPGTGVAPFRAFMEEREAIGATGKNWLFFGDQHFTTDFLYQAEWLKYHKSGLLNKLSVAFSRDQVQKIYVQHRMAEQSREFYEWLQDGATVYVCGDEKRMAHDVHDAIINVVANEGALSREHAEEYVKLLQKEKRYQRDVY